MMKDLINALANSKKFTVAIIGVIVGIGSRLGLHLDPETVGIILSPFVAYIFAQGQADKGKHAAQITALATVDPGRAGAVLKKKAETK
jgi:uncharacterized protein YqgC (DUF456 family)